QDHALKHARGFFRDADGHLCGLTAKIGKRQHQTGCNRPQWIEASEERNDNCRKTIARRNDGAKLADSARSFRNPRKTGKSTRNRKDEEHHLARTETRKAP